MRKIIVHEFITLDGVIQAPGGTGEDTSNGFKFGGWVAPYMDDKALEQPMQEQLQPADLLLGRKTFEIWENYWPQHADMWPGIMEVTKYVLSTTRTNSDWEPSVFLPDVEAIKKLKDSEGSDLKIWGSSELVHLLLKHDLVDEFWLNIHPIILGSGKRLFDAGSMPAAYRLAASVVAANGVIVAHYIKSGEVKTGDVGS
ncbi:MAG: dihydrofolate reductase family protein [Chitinophagales bacterium]